MTTSTTTQTAPHCAGPLKAARKAVALASLALAVLATGPAMAGHVANPINHWDTVPANGTDTYHLTFDNTEAAFLEADGSGAGDIDMYVYDQDGARVDFDDLSDSDPMCSWTPDETQVFTVHIVNRRNYAIEYHLTSN